MKKILITGCAGFIGFHLSKLLLDKKNIVIGIDNVNNYYSIKLKEHRLKILLGYKNFIFKKYDIADFQSLDKIFIKNKFDIIINLAAQAGVGYSMKFPEKYFNSNIQGFFNICNLAKKYKIKKVLYASSSSVYGDNKSLPVKEIYKTNPLNYYAISKENNEKTAEFFSKIGNTRFIGFRFFSIYGPYGRPDMLIYKLLNCHEKKEIFYLNNNGNHTRDFTYIDDVISIIYDLINKRLSKKSEIFNISNTKMIKLKTLINLMSEKNIKPSIKMRGFQKGDIKDACGSNIKIRKILKNQKFTPFEIGLDKTLLWYKNNKKIF
tara:strand:+ start:221 stop:1180 length:960 start_codon:yes stop_codon:yes gene_type:complete